MYIKFNINLTLYSVLVGKLVFQMMDRNNCMEMCEEQAVEQTPHV